MTEAFGLHGEPNRDGHEGTPHQYNYSFTLGTPALDNDGYVTFDVFTVGYTKISRVVMSLKQAQEFSEILRACKT